VPAAIKAHLDELRAAGRLYDPEAWRWRPATVCPYCATLQPATIRFDEGEATIACDGCDRVASPQPDWLSREAAAAHGFLAPPFLPAAGLPDE
jgi:hypothetical protein